MIKSQFLSQVENLTNQKSVTGYTIIEYTSPTSNVFFDIGDEIQESIRTIQRTLDAVFALDRREDKPPRGTPLAARSTQVSSNASSLQLRLSVGSFLGEDRNGDRLHASPLGLYASNSGLLETGQLSRATANHGKQYRNEAIATPMVRDHVHFLKRG
jgi:hypothetical protein